MRIALGSLLVECNHLGGAPTTLDRFRAGVLRYGDELLATDSGSVGGALGVLREASETVLPLLEASACPGGPLTAQCYDHLKDDLLLRLGELLPLDGVLLCLHGSAAAENAPDLEGDLLGAVRDMVGSEVPIVATLDPHGHVTQAMMSSADALIAFETYPHIDTVETGRRAARLLLETVRGEVRPAMAMAKVPVLVSGVNGGTARDKPFGRVMCYARGLENEGAARRGGILSSSAFLVHPYLDLPGMGGGGLVVTDGDPARAEELAIEIARRYWAVRRELEPETNRPAAAIEQGLRVAGGPILLVECADCAGGGAAGDSVATLKALLAIAPRESALVPVVDAEAAAACHRAGVGADVELNLGHKLDPKWGSPVRMEGNVERLGDGAFRYEGGLWGGEVGHMGATAVLAVGAIRILITSNATYDWAYEQFTSVGLDVRQAKFVVVKNPMNFSMGYAGVASAALVLDTPGPTPATLRCAGHRNIDRPCWPLDPEMPDPVPRLLRGRYSLS